MSERVVILETEPPDSIGWQERTVAIFVEHFGQTRVALARQHRDQENPEWRAWQDCGIDLSPTAVEALRAALAPVASHPEGSEER